MCINVSKAALLSYGDSCSSGSTATRPGILSINFRRITGRRYRLFTPAVPVVMTALALIFGYTGADRRQLACGLVREARDLLLLARRALAVRK